HALSAGQQSAVLGASAGFSVGYTLRGLHAAVQKNGTVLVTGRLGGGASPTPPGVRLLTYKLSGTITDASGKPVEGAVVITRTQDRDFWTHSDASDASGHYTSFFAASDESSADPVPLSVGVALGSVAYGGTTGTIANFARLKSSTMNIQLGAGASYTVQKPTAFSGAIYEGLTVRVTERVVDDALDARKPSGQIVVQAVPGRQFCGRRVADAGLPVVVPDEHLQRQVERGERRRLHHGCSRGRTAEDDDLGVAQRETLGRSRAAVVEHREERQSLRRNRRRQPGDGLGHGPRTRARDDGSAHGASTRGGASGASVTSTAIPRSIRRTATRKLAAMIPAIAR